MLEELLGQSAEAQVTPEEPTQEVTTPVEATTEPVIEQEVETPQLQDIEINGQRVSLDEVRQGYMRQQDYVAKQQQIQNRLQEAEQSMKLVEYLRSNPHIAQRLYEDKNVDTNVSNVVNPAMKEIESLRKELFQDKLNNTITSLKTKYADFNEVEVMNRAVSMGITDLEFAYHGMRGANLDNIVAQRVKEELAKATEKINANAQATRTVIGGGQAPQATTTHNLLPQEMRVADMMGLSYEDYAKYK